MIVAPSAQQGQSELRAIPLAAKHRFTKDHAAETNAIQAAQQAIALLDPYAVGKPTFI
jgi:hypothetical protein